MTTIKDRLNFVLQDTFDSYEIIESYIQRYYAIKQMNVALQVSVEENQVEQGFLQQQVNMISKLQIFKRNFIFNLVDIENENVQKSISQ